MPTALDITNMYSNSVVICTKNRASDLKECLISIFDQSVLPNEIVIIDGSDNILTQSLFNSFFLLHDKLTVKYLHSAPSLTKQRNLGIKLCACEIISFLDDDVILDVDYFKEIINCFSVSNNINGVDGKNINIRKPNILKSLFRKVFLLSRLDGNKGIMLRSGFQVLQWASNDNNYRRTHILCGCASYKRSILISIPFDECFDGYGFMEDAEYSYRVSKKHILYHNPKALFFHKKSKCDRINAVSFYEMKVFNHFYVFKKHFACSLYDWILFWWSDIGITIKAIIDSIKLRNLTPIYGLYRGHKKIILNFRSLPLSVEEQNK